MNPFIFSKYDAIIFDLDGTLYDDSVYYEEVNRQISEHIEEQHKIPAVRVRAFLSTGLSYSHLDNQFKIHELDACLKIRRSCKMPQPIELFPHMKDLLLEWKGKVNFMVLTNGNKQQQQNKVAQINWPVPIDVFYADPHKPDPSGIFEIQKKYGTLKCLMIGDSKEDQECAKNAKIDFIFVHELR